MRSELGIKKGGGAEELETTHVHCSETNDFLTVVPQKPTPVICTPAADLLFYKCVMSVH